MCSRLKYGKHLIAMYTGHRQNKTPISIISIHMNMQQDCRFA